MRRRQRKARRLTELRLTEFERQMSHIEDWTGCHTDEELPDLEDPTVKEMLAAQKRIIRHLLITLDVVLPGFSIDRFRKALPRVDDALTESGDIELEPGDRQRMLLIMEGLIPGPLPRPEPAQTDRFRPTLVPKAPDRPDDDAP